MAESRPEKLENIGELWRAQRFHQKARLKPMLLLQSDSNRADKIRAEPEQLLGLDGRGLVDDCRFSHILSLVPRLRGSSG